ncbi:MAG: hypothetical protein AAFQ54_10410 [Pseudomonadota bacterium]
MPDTGDDFAGAIVHVTRALATAARQLDRAALPSNLDEGVDTIIAEVRGLNRAGDTLRREATRTKGATAPAILARAFAAYDAALEICTREQHAVDWAMTQHNLALAKAGGLGVEGTFDPSPHLAEALVHVEVALSVFFRAHMGHSHAAAVQLSDSMRAELNTLLWAAHRAPPGKGLRLEAIAAAIR